MRDIYIDLNLQTEGSQLDQEQQMPPKPETPPLHVVRRRFLQGLGFGAAGALAPVIGETEHATQKEVARALTQGVNKSAAASLKAIRLAMKYNFYFDAQRAEVPEVMGKERSGALLDGRVVFYGEGQQTYAIPEPLLVEPRVVGKDEEMKEGFLPGVNLLDPTNPYSFWILYQGTGVYDDSSYYYPLWLGDQNVKVELNDGAQKQAWRSECLGCTPDGQIGIVPPGAYEAGPPFPGRIQFIGS